MAEADEVEARSSRAVNKGAKTGGHKECCRRHAIVFIACLLSNWHLGGGGDDDDQKEARRDLRVRKGRSALGATSAPSREQVLEALLWIAKICALRTRPNFVGDEIKEEEEARGEVEEARECIDGQMGERKR